MTSQQLPHLGQHHIPPMMSQHQQLAHLGESSHGFPFLGQSPTSGFPFFGQQPPSPAFPYHGQQPTSPVFPYHGQQSSIQAFHQFGKSPSPVFVRGQSDQASLPPVTGQHFTGESLVVSTPNNVVTHVAASSVNSKGETLNEYVYLNLDFQGCL